MTRPGSFSLKMNEKKSDLQAIDLDGSSHSIGYCLNAAGAGQGDGCGVGNVRV